MNTKICENAALYFYGEMDTQEAAAFKKHLPGCSKCQKELEFLELTQAALVPPAAPQSVVERVMAPAAARVSRWSLSWKKVLVGVCAAFLLGLGLTAGLKQQPGVSAADGLLGQIIQEYEDEYLAFAADLDLFEMDFWDLED